MYKSLITFLLIAVLSSCGQGITGKHEENLKKLDEVYGPCDNPHRQLTKNQKQVCKDKQRAAGPDGEVGEPISLTGLLSGMDGNNNKIVYQSQVNKELWDASIIVFKSYPIKLLDFDGGVLETDWIVENNNPNKRCLIRAHITSVELLSNGVNVKIICENKSNDDWFFSNENFVNQEKKLTLKILEEATKLSQANKL